MADTRTKVDALKDLGEKVTGATIVADENETIVGMIDKIANNYEGGGSGGGQNIAYLTKLYEGGDEDTWEVFTDEECVAELNKVKDNYVQTGTIPVVVQVDSSSRRKNPYPTREVYYRKFTTGEEMFTLKIYDIDNTSATYYIDTYEYEFRDNVWKTRWTYVGE